MRLPSRYVEGNLNFVLDTCFSCTKWMASVSVNLFRVPDSQPSFSRPLLHFSLT